MPLRVLDGNQTATTLSSVVTGGEHIVAHTVVSLGATAISNITSAVSGSVVSISNFPSTQTIAGTVTANVTSIPTIFSISNYGSLGTSNFITDNNGPQNDLGLGIAYNTDATDPGFAKIVSENYPLPISGTVTANVAGQYFDFTTGDTAQLVNPVYYDGEIVRVTPNAPLPVTIRPAPYGQTTVTISGTVTANAFVQSAFGLGEDIAAGMTEAGGIPISGTVKVANDYNGNDKEILVGPLNSDFNGGEGRVGVELINKNGVSLVVTGPALNISGTVTARLQDGSGNNLSSTSIGGLQRLNVSLASAATPGGSIPTFVNVYGGSDGSAVRTISVDSTGRQNTNVQLPRVTLIDGSGTVTTANTAITVFASSSTRSYLLVQVTTGSAFVNVGATATTVNGINLTAGQGYAWETTIPQGIVSLISATTSSRYVAKEA